MLRNLLPILTFALLGGATPAFGQSPYDEAPEAESPYCRVRYEASGEPGGLDMPVQYTVWIPPRAGTLRGVVVHQHGCGVGSCRSGLTGAFDLHWQALAAEHDCALLAAVYEQPEGVDCSRWCDPRNGSAAAFRHALADLAVVSERPELGEVPWALWGHSGGATWCGSMMLLYPERVAAVWMRSGVPLLTPRAGRAERETIDLPSQPLAMPMMLNLGTREGVTDKTTRFAGLWPRVQAVFEQLRAEGCLVGVATDPLTGHECGNQRYLAIPWFDACLSVRLAEQAGRPLRPMPAEQGWLAQWSDDPADAAIGPHGEFLGDRAKATWLPDRATAQAWKQYVTDTAVADPTPPPAPTNVRMADGVLTWDAAADLQSGIRQFVISRDGVPIATVPQQARNPYGRPLFQGLQYSDTPEQPLAEMKFRTADQSAEASAYRVTTVNTVGLKSPQ